MPAKVISTKSAEHYKWGGPQSTDCDGWHLVKADTLSIIEELMPPGTAETRHSHVHARQFFYVLEGELTLDVEYHDFIVHPGEGIEVSPGQRHQAKNKSTSPLRIIVTSHPPQPRRPYRRINFPPLNHRYLSPHLSHLLRIDGTVEERH